jgi:hypothetical protein
MPTPFDAVIEEIRRRGYHNQRLEVHSDIISSGVWDDLLTRCVDLRADFEAGVVTNWYNVPSPGARGRRIDLLVAPRLTGSKGPDIANARICVENKSVITAHRNAPNRFDDLTGVLEVLHGYRPEMVTAAIVLVGTATKVLNVPDKIMPLYKKRRMTEFNSEILPRLSSGDESLLAEFDYAVSENRPDDPQRTLDLFLKLPRRPPAHTHVLGYDYLLLVPVYIDNVRPPRLLRENSFAIDIDTGYAALLTGICDAYSARWHP